MFFLATSNFIKNALEHSNVEDLVPMARKNRYAWGKVNLIDTLLVFWGNFIQTWKL